MSFDVIWVSEAEQELAALWTEAKDRSRITRGAYQIDRVLGNHPEDAGESRAEGWRILIDPPLAVYFVVSPEDRRVLVLHVWRIDPRRPSS